MKPFRLAKSYLSSQKYTLSLYILIVVSISAISILSPYLIGDFLDSLISGGSIDVILRFCAIFGGVSLLKIVMNYITSILNVKMQTQMSYRLNRDVIEHIQGLSFSYINRNDSAYLSQRTGGDSVGVVAFCIGLLQSIITKTILLIAPFVILLQMNWLVAVIMLGFVMVYAVLYFVFMKPLYNAKFAYKEAQDSFFSKLYEQLKFIKLIKINSTQKEMFQRVDSSFTGYKSTAIHNQKVSHLYSGLDGTISTIAQIALFVIGGTQILVGNFTIGMFTIFTSYFNMMLGASRYFFGLGASYQNVLVSYNRIKDILDRKLETQGKKIIEDISKIDLRDLGFSYEAHKDVSDKQSTQENGATQTKVVLNNFHATFTKGSIYAIVGANGTGKSTLVSLIMGMYIDEYTGNVTYDGVDIRDIDMVATRKCIIGFAEQEPLLINESIGFNLGLGDDLLFGDKSVGYGSSIDAKSLSIIKKYAKILKMEDFISERSLDFEINEKNTNTSGGEKQKISILKVLYKDPSVMIFDEPTSALDAETGKTFIEHLNEIKNDKIIIIISHDEEIVEWCDKIIEFDREPFAAM